MVWLQRGVKRHGRVCLQARSWRRLSSAKFRCDRGRTGARTTGGSRKGTSQRHAWGTALRATQLYFSAREAARGGFQAQCCCDAGDRVTPKAALFSLGHEHGALTQHHTATASNAQGPGRRTVLITARFWSANNSAPRSAARCMVGTAPTLAHHAASPGQQTEVSSTGSSSQVAHSAGPSPIITSISLTESSS